MRTRHQHDSEMLLAKTDVPKGLFFDSLKFAEDNTAEELERLYDRSMTIGDGCRRLENIVRWLVGSAVALWGYLAWKATVSGFWIWFQALGAGWFAGTFAALLAGFIYYRFLVSKQGAAYSPQMLRNAIYIRANAGSLASRIGDLGAAPSVLAAQAPEATPAE